MKRLFISILVLVLAPTAFAGERSMLARVTVYWRGEGQLLACSNGARLRDGHCAVDPKKIPYGSTVLFADATCIAVDSGPAVVSRKAARSCGRSASERNAIVIDRFFETKQQALSWAKANPHFMTVRVVTPEKGANHNTPLIAAKDSDASVAVDGHTSAMTLASWSPFQFILGL
jgi:3D (Asp-Asp-Asp) domain-containing protein